MTSRMLLLVTVLIGGGLLPAAAQPQRPAPPSSLRLYVFDCGKLDIPDITPYRLTRAEIATSLMSVPCYLVAHPRGTLMWEVGAVPDSLIPPGGTGTLRRYGTSSKPLKAQLAEISYRPADIDYLAFSHFHWDHLGNANDFASATWLVRQKERNAMFAEPPSPRTERAHFERLRTAKTVIVTAPDHDVFGDGTVVIKSAPGHSPDHQVLFVNLPRTGPLVLSGDLYHYPEERTLDRVPSTEFDAAETAASRAAIDAFLARTRAQLWIEHDYMADAKLKKSPQFYD
jgi:N-acyl homoserine lactone hydrolase